MRKKSCQKDWPRVPERFGGIQVNGCGAPDCENFGLSPVHEERICKESNRETDDRQILEMPEPFRIQGTGLNSAAQTPRKDHLSRQIREDQRIEKGQWINPSTLFVARPCQTRSTLSERLAINGAFLRQGTRPQSSGGKGISTPFTSSMRSLILASSTSRSSC